MSELELLFKVGGLFNNVELCLVKLLLKYDEVDNSSTVAKSLSQTEYLRGGDLSLNSVQEREEALHKPN